MPCRIASVANCSAMMHSLTGKGVESTIRWASVSTQSRLASCDLAFVTAAVMIASNVLSMWLVWQVQVAGR